MTEQWLARVGLVLGVRVRIPKNQCVTDPQPVCDWSPGPRASLCKCIPAGKPNYSWSY